MNTALLSEAQVMALDPQAVMVPERIGFLHHDKAAALGRLMAVDGQRDPIKVVLNLPSKSIEACAAEGKKPWRLVTGMHRLMGARLEQIAVYAIEVKGKAEDLAELEASENIHRRPLGPIERAKFVAALVQAAQERIAREHGELKQQQLAVKARWARVKSGEARAEEALRDETEDTCAKFARVYGWEESACEAFDLSRRAIYNDLTLNRMLIEPFPELIEALSKHPVVGQNASQLKALAAIKDEGRRRAAIEALLADHTLSADEARVLVGVDMPSAEPSSPYRKYEDAVIGNWSRLSHHTLHFIPRFAEVLTGPQALAMRKEVERRIAALKEQGKLGGDNA